MKAFTHVSVREGLFSGECLTREGAMEFHANLDTALDREGRHVPGVIKAVISITVIDVLVTLLSLSIH